MATKKTYPWDGRKVDNNKELKKWWDSLSDLDKKNIYILMDYAHDSAVDDFKYMNWR